MSTENRKQLQDENYLATLGRGEVNNELIGKKELTEAIEPKLDSEYVQEVEQENLEPSIKPEGCVWVKPCPGTNNSGCLICS
ncbi:hypothetical protein DSM106972_095400 [Dulcicalothrix desertica PCC 7102]|uniref:Uncharacterized protein n=1 Tax=Dulcicalothrix desertica PCC 7102 TaxID=232991 RepID=A0A433UIV5_9CYAN|nr:hypothetical protein [Dulcicalothrix desertica]RUS93781.1 hypothetical protein DSM106972_095400 [Dulcicalothrix desertica PCC 7102]TWH62740.1 hypothetical protein CAL7102_00257 [Dulcicalothrix desertica PCC 7102]